MTRTKAFVERYLLSNDNIIVISKHLAQVLNYSGFNKEIQNKKYIYNRKGREQERL